MKQFKLRKAFVAVLCAATLLGLAGCSDDDDPPENISGTWAVTFSDGTETKLESWTFIQNGQNVTGSYTYGANVWRFTGTYVDGVFNGVDADRWVLRIEFEGDEGSGTIAGDGEVWTAELRR
jgi:hypothetical protein